MKTVEHVPGTAGPGWRCNHCHGVRRVKVKSRRRTRDVYDEVRAIVLNLIAQPQTFLHSFRKEDLAASLGVKDHCVEQALARLNREGLVHQPVHGVPHDCNRSTRLDWGSDSSWVGDRYKVRLPEKGVV